MSLVYLQSMCSESCFSECSRNKQQTLLLRVSTLASVAQPVPCRAELLSFGPLTGLLLFLMASEACTGSPLHPTSCLS